MHAVIYLFIYLNYFLLLHIEVVKSLLAKQWEVVMGRQVELRAYTLSSLSPFLHRKEEAVRATLDIPLKIDKNVCTLFSFSLEYYN